MYHDIFGLPGDSLPLTELVSHRIILKDDIPVNIITSEGIKPNPNKINAVKDFKRPTNQKEVKSFLGLSGYYRKFIMNFSTIAKPLIELTKKDQPFNWTNECDESFKILKELLCSSPVLRYRDYDKDFTLTTDASNVGLGAVLSQDGHPICYISRTY